MAVGSWQVNWAALLQPGMQLEPWQQEKLKETVAAMSYSLGSSAMPWLKVTASVCMCQSCRVVQCESSSGSHLDCRLAQHRNGVSMPNVICVRLDPSVPSLLTPDSDQLTVMVRC